MDAIKHDDVGSPFVVFFHVQAHAVVDGSKFANRVVPTIVARSVPLEGITLASLSQWPNIVLLQAVDPVNRYSDNMLNAIKPCSAFIVY